MAGSIGGGRDSYGDRLLIEPAVPARPDGQFTEVAELTF
jgi:hypothetical protein